jgi:hypothetical protein
MKIKLIFLTLAATLAAVLFTGCQTFNDNLEPNALASVTVTNKPVSAIVQATATVFANHGFTGGQTGSNQYTYHRLGSRINNLAYENYEFNEPVTVQIVVNILPLNANSTEIACKAWLIEDAGDPVFSDSHQVRLLRRWPYEQLLKDIKSQLGE